MRERYFGKPRQCLQKLRKGSLKGGARRHAGNAVCIGSRVWKRKRRDTPVEKGPANESCHNHTISDTPAQHYGESVIDGKDLSVIAVSSHRADDARRLVELYIEEKNLMMVIEDIF